MKPEGASLSPTSAGASSIDHRSRPAARTREACKGCGSTRFEIEDDAVICTGCGNVLRQGLLETSFGNPERRQGLTRVNAIGRDASSAVAQNAMIYARSNSTQQTKEQQQFKREIIMRRRLSNVAASLHVNQTEIFRALYLWEHLESHTNCRYTVIAFRELLACFYLATRESKKGLTISHVALASGQYPCKVAVVYAKVKAILAEKKVIDLSSSCFDVERDPGLLLDQIKTIGSTDSNLGCDLDRLPPFLKEVFGVGSEDRGMRLRKIWVSAQKCLQIATDSGLASGRQLQGLVAACLIVAVEVDLQLEACPDSLMAFAAQCFYVMLSTVEIRYKELRKYMLKWAQRLPYVPNRISPSKLVYYLEDVLKYFGHLEEVNKNLWKMLDDPNQGDSDEEEAALEQGDSQLELATDEGCSEMKAHSNASSDAAKDPTIHTPKEISDIPIVDTPKEISVGPIVATPENASVDLITVTAVECSANSFDIALEETSVGPASREETDAPLYDILDSMSSQSRYQPVYPPAFVANQKRRKEQAMRILVAKHQLKQPPGLLRKTATGQKRTEWVKRLVELGQRSEEVLLSASDKELAMWCGQDELNVAHVGERRSERELNSCELSDQDLSEQEFRQYLRTESESKTMWRVVGPAIIEHEKRSKEIATQKADASSKLGRRKRKALEALPGYKKPRSSKLRLEALSDIEDESDQSQQWQLTPGTRAEPEPLAGEEEIVGVLGEDAVDIQQEQLSYVQHSPYDDDDGDDDGNNYYEEGEGDDYSEFDY